MSRNSTERCNTCSAPAAVRMQGVSLCGRCGLERSSGLTATSRRSRRAVLVGLFSSGFLAKILAGAVALAAVGGVAVTVPRAAPEAQTGTAVVAPAFVEAASPVAAGTAEPTEETALPAEVLVQRAFDYALEMQRWGDCVSTLARAHSGGALDFAAVCGETPAASDHGLGKENAPGQTKTNDNSPDNNGLGKENAPGQTRTNDDQAEARSVDKPDKPEKALSQGGD